ncbi:MAG: tyrosine/phenylalanine carboxypeptidase domain-containing protein, partial [Thermomonas sp.]
MTTTRSPDIAHHAALDARMTKAAREIRLLSLVSWPASEQQQFLADHARGQAKLPAYAYPKHDFSAERTEFEAIAAAADPSHPLGIYLIESAYSWRVAAELLESLGTPKVTGLSIALFGKPDHTLPGGATMREAAGHFIGIANELDQELLAPSEQVEISATSLRLQLQASLDDYFDARVITVELDPDLIAKAAAGATRIRL